MSMTIKEVETCKRALAHVVDSIARWRGAVHGDDADGNCDVEFGNLWFVMAWATEYSVRAIIELRDPVSTLTGNVVITFSLHDYAACRARSGFPV